MLNKTNTSYKLFCLLTLLLCACTEVPEHCGDRFPALNPSAQFCYQGRVEDKCGGKEYDPSTQGCYGNVIRNDANTLTINVVGNGTVSRSPNGVDYKWETEVTVTANPTDNNYVFTGWTGALESESPMITITMSGDKTLTAKFVKLEANQFVVTLNTNGGTGSQASVITDTNGKLTSMPVPPTKTGYTFEGWFTETTGGTQVTTDLTFAANKTIYARWIAVSYTITYSLNGGKVQYANRTNYTVETATFTLNNPTREEFTFTGWTGNDITTPQKNVSVTIGSMGNRNYTANWKSNIEGTYTITYELNGGTVKPDNPNSYTTETTTFTLTNPTREGYTFAGWTGTNGETQSSTIAQGSTGDKSYTANWKPMIYTISYTSTGGWDSLPYNPRTYTIETESFTLNNPTWRGYTFTGWTGTNGATPQTTVSVAQGSMGNRSYVANWTLETYSITYNLNEGTVAIANPTSYTMNTGGGFTLNNPTRPGYTFTGWTGTNGEKPQVTVSVAQGSTGNRSYVANWTLETYSITYNLNGGTTATDNPKSYNITTGSFTLNNPTRSGYTFTGWTENPNQTPQTTVSIAQGSTGNKSYAANWTQITITFDTNGGSVTPTSATVNTQGKLTIDLPTPTKNGNTFTGWATANGTSVTINMIFTENATIYAQWSDDFETVEIGGNRWMKNNLKIATLDSWCYGNYPDNCSKYGRLYTWNAAQTACPSGWHLPSAEEWTALIDFVGGDTIAGRELKSKTDWIGGTATDKYRFSALPGGYRNENGIFFHERDNGFWWTTDTVGFYNNNGYGFSVRCFNMYYGSDWVSTSFTNKEYGFSVRCVQN